MTTARRNRRTRTLATAATLMAAAGLTAGCGSEEPPETDAEIAIPTPEATEESPDSTEAADVGAYDQALRESLTDYSGEVVTLTGEVAEVVPSRTSLEITDPGNPDLDPLLVSARYAIPDIETGDVVEVTGTVQEDFSPPVAEPAAEGDEEAGFYDQHLGEPYLDEAVVEATGPAGP